LAVSGALAPSRESPADTAIRGGVPAGRRKLQEANKPAFPRKPPRFPATRAKSQTIAGTIAATSWTAQTTYFAVQTIL